MGFYCIILFAETLVFVVTQSQLRTYYCNRIVFQALKALDREVSKALSGLEYPPLAICAMGFDAATIGIPVDAFGFLVPFSAKRKVLGTLYDSSIFPSRAPEGKVLLRSMAGGARAADVAMMEEGRIADTVLEELKAVAGVRADPVFVKVYRHEQAIPQYNVGHRAVVAEAARAEGRHKGLYLTGNALKGVSLNDCIASNLALARRMGQELMPAK